MNFSGIAKGSLVGTLLRAPLAALPKSSVLRILQGRARGMKWVVGSSNHGCWLGSYEFATRSLIERTVTEGMVAFDIGAHVGFYTLLFSTLVGKGGKVVAFEPFPENLAYLRKHVELNGLTNVEVLDAAVSDQPGEARFQIGAASQMGSLDPEGTLTVKTIAVDDLIASGELPVPTVMKIDVEGAEGRVLEGMKQLLANSHPTIILSTHGAAVHKECCERLRALGYKLEAVNGGDVESCDEVLATFA